MYDNSLKSAVVPLFEKVLSASDAGRIGRLVLPKACAEVSLGFCSLVSLFSVLALLSLYKSMERCFCNFFCL